MPRRSPSPARSAEGEAPSARPPSPPGRRAERARTSKKVLRSQVSGRGHPKGPNIDPQDPGHAIGRYLVLLGMLGERLKGNLDLLLLTVLTTGPAHGYEIAERLRQNSDGAFDLPEGTVYPALHRLEARDWIHSSWRVEGGRRRRVYELTGRGRRQLAAQRREWGAFVAGMSAILGGSLA